MSERLISILLVGFAVSFLMVILFWRTFRKIFGLGNPAHSASRLKYDRLKGIHFSYRVILVAFAGISTLYFVFPATQSWFHTINWLNNDWVNLVGCILLMIAFFLVIRTQIRLDQTIHEYYVDSTLPANAEMVPKTEDHLLRSILLVFTGMFVVVSTWATAVLLLMSYVVYYVRSTNRKYKIKTPVTAKQLLYL